MIGPFDCPLGTTAGSLKKHIVAFVPHSAHDSIGTVALEVMIERKLRQLRCQVNGEYGEIRGR